MLVCVERNSNDIGHVDRIAAAAAVLFVFLCVVVVAVVVAFARVANALLAVVLLLLVGGQGSQRQPCVGQHCCQHAMVVWFGLRAETETGWCVSAARQDRHVDARAVGLLDAALQLLDDVPALLSDHVLGAGGGAAAAVVAAAVVVVVVVVLVFFFFCFLLSFCFFL